MRNFLIGLLLLAFGCAALPVRADHVTAALKKLKKDQPQAARKRLDKTLRKHPANAGAHYVFALYYLGQYRSAVPSPTASLAATGSSAYTEVYLDSAAASAQAAANAFAQTEKGALRRWQRAGIDAKAVQAVRQTVDSLAFTVTEAKHSVAGYQSFIDRFPTAPQKSTAIEKRDELAYAEAVRINTYKSYKKFLETYPDARQAREAEKLYELLLFEFLTQDDDIAAYEKFIEVQPRSPYRDEAERRLYELSTLAHTRQAYHDFVRRHPGSPFAAQAWQWIYSLYRDEDQPEDAFLKNYPDFPDKEYVRKRAETDPLAYFPFFEEESNKFGFVDANGRLQVAARYDSVATDYFCDGVKTNAMLVYRQRQLGAVDKTGREITGFGYESIEPLEGELLLVKQNGSVGVWHQGGFAVLPVQYQAVEVLNETFLLVQQEGKYGLANFFGGRVGEAVYDEIKNLGDGLVAFRQNGRYAVVHNSLLLERKFPVLAFLYDSVEWVRQDVRVRIGTYEGVVNANLQPVVSPAPVRLQPLPAGWLADNGTYRQLLDAKGRLLADSLDAATGNASFFAARRGGSWAVWKVGITPRLKFDYDTAVLLGTDGFAVKKLTNPDKPNSGVFYAFFAPDVFLKLGNFQHVSLLQSEGTPTRRWLLVTDKAGNQGLLTVKGQPVLPAKHSRISPLSPDLIAFQSGGRWGLVDATGRQLLPALYNALSYEKGFVSTLKNGRFGLLHLERGIDIPPQYERIVKPYTDNSLLFIAAKNGKYGFITADNEPASEFAFDEIRHWQYGVALVRQADKWHLYHIADKKFTFRPLEDFKYIRQDEKETTIRIYADRKYGVMSNTCGLIVDCEYDDLRNVGTEAIPFYLAEKHVDSAEVYLIFYLDRNGKKVQKQLFDQKRYERMGCE